MIHMEVNAPAPISRKAILSVFLVAAIAGCKGYDAPQKLQGKAKQLETCVMTTSYMETLVRKKVYEAAEIERAVAHLAFDEKRACYYQKWLFPEGIFVYRSEWISGEKLEITYPLLDPFRHVTIMDSVLVRPIGGDLDFGKTYQRGVSGFTKDSAFVLASGTNVYRSNLERSKYVAFVVNEDLFGVAPVDDVANIDIENQKGLMQVASNLGGGYELRYAIPTRHAERLEEWDGAVRHTVGEFMLDN